MIRLNQAASIVWLSLKIVILIVSIYALGTSVILYQGF